MINNNNPSCVSSSYSSIPTTFFGLLLLHSRCNTTATTSSELLRDFATREFNVFLWLSLIVITALLLRKLFTLFNLWFKAQYIPGPPSPSFFGHCHLISRQNLTKIKVPVFFMYVVLILISRLEFKLKCFLVQKRRELLATELNERLIRTADPIPMKVEHSIMDKIENIRTRGSIDGRLVSQHMAFAIMGTTFFGDGFLAWPEAAIYEELLMMIAKDACFWASSNHCKKRWKLFAHIDQNVNDESKMEMKSGHGDLNDHQNSKEEPCGNIMRVMFHGCQTTDALIANVLTRLAMHREIQDKVYSEIIKVGRNPSKYEHEDVYRMPLLLATIVSGEEDLSLRTGETILAGAILVVPVQLVHKDDSNWGSDASDFNLYRYQSNSSTEELNDARFSSFALNDPNENAAFLPFGYGARACVGQKFVIKLLPYCWHLY
ncbi:hypothetical protein RIF29_14813 [Crotalaria pallida]|uniref:Cytochrome P450 n=1 Tax=Crotalaria pallida TaxID=3830 RepID=A0AAN9FHT5_CROPI